MCCSMPFLQRARFGGLTCVGLERSRGQLTHALARTSTSKQLILNEAMII